MRFFGTAVMLFAGVLMALSRDGGGTDEIVRIEFSASGCFGVCPAYTVAFTSDGGAELVWKPLHRQIIARRDSFFAKIVRENSLPESLLTSRYSLRFVGEVAPEKFRKLAEIFEKDDFFLTEDYSERVTDLPGYRFTARTQKKEHSVRMYGLHPPEKMTRWREKIYDLMRSVRWRFEGTAEN